MGIWDRETKTLYEKILKKGNREIGQETRRR